ncbi:MAG TPA: ester cyclase [Gaiellaceae bacterium]
MSTEQNKSIVRRAFDSMSEGQDQFLAEHDEIYGENLVGHFSGMPPVDRDMHRQFGLATYSSFPDLKRPVEDLVAEGDKVVARWSSVGTHSGDFMGTPPSGKTVRTTGITIFRLADGKIVEEWSESDMLGMLQQVGALPMPEPA